MILGEKSERRDQSSISCLKNINFWKSLPRAPEFKYPPLCNRHGYGSKPTRTILYIFEKNIFKQF